MNESEARIAQGRPLRPTSVEMVYHTLNRANARRTLFKDEEDYAAFAKVLGLWTKTESLPSKR